jgi:hypothetical protein
MHCDEQCDQTKGRGAYVTLEQHDSIIERLGANWTGYNFGIHHLDGNKSNDRWWNLLALDNSCHLNIQARVIVERPWLFDHSEWFVPYVCGFYASYYGGFEITRVEADADPARWLALNPAAPSERLARELAGTIATDRFVGGTC